MCSSDLTGSVNGMRLQDKTPATRGSQGASNNKRELLGERPRAEGLPNLWLGGVPPSGATPRRSRSWADGRGAGPSLPPGVGGGGAMGHGAGAPMVARCPEAR